MSDPNTKIDRYETRTVKILTSCSVGFDVRYRLWFHAAELHDFLIELDLGAGIWGSNVAKVMILVSCRTSNDTQNIVVAFDSFFERLQDDYCYAFTTAIAISVSVEGFTLTRWAKEASRSKVLIIIGARNHVSAACNGSRTFARPDRSTGCVDSNKRR